MDSQFQKLLSDEELGKQLLGRMIGENENACNLSEEGILETCLNLLMKAEREVHLDGSGADKGNGYFERSLGTPSGKLALKVPRDRDGDFRPTVLPTKYARATEQRFDLLKRLFAVRYSPNEIALRPTCSPSRLFRPSSSKASADSSPPLLPRLLLAGAIVARWDFLPL